MILFSRKQILFTALYALSRSSQQLLYSSLNALACFRKKGQSTLTILYPDVHPAESLKWFRSWDYPEDLIHDVEAHAFSYNGFNTMPNSPLAAALIACDEIRGIFYTYQKINPIPFGEMKAKSIKKRLKEKAFAAKIDREIIYMGCEKLGVSIDDHVSNLIHFFAKL